MKTGRNKLPRNANTRKTRRMAIIIGIILLAAIAVYYFYKTYGIDRNNSELVKPEGPSFTKNGNLMFINRNNNDTIKSIDIEVADSEEKREMGLMWRRSMPDTVGMLFIFEEETPQSFWMKNTYIPLDIIFINSNKEIVAIREETAPLSEESIPSVKPAQYVVEVIGGFCYKNKIQVGDKIAF